MARAKLDPAVLAHLDWLGFVQPKGLVVSAPALVRAGAILDNRDSEGQRLIRACLDGGAGLALDEVRERPAPYGSTESYFDFRALAESVLGWSFSPQGYAGTPESPIPSSLDVTLPEYGVTLRPDYAVRELDPGEGRPAWQLLIRVLEPGQDFDHAVHEGSLEASPHSLMERLLRGTRVEAGLLVNGRTLRLLSAPHGESSGWVDFKVADMEQTGGRPISSALRLLLGQTRLLALPKDKRLAALLEDSRKFQNEVSERLAEQVLHALNELLRGFQAANDASHGELLRRPLTDQPDEVYRAMLTVILRLVFLLYAEERDMLPADDTFMRYYSLAGLHKRLREDAGLFPDTMDQRFGAWAQLVVLFRMIHYGARTGAVRLPPRHGALFDPERFPFLEGRAEARQEDETIAPPLVPDGTIFRALEDLLVLDGERISYRALDVEQIGSVYETMMGFRLEIATGPSVAIKPAKKHGAPETVDLEMLLAEPVAKRPTWLQDVAGRKITDRIAKAVRDAGSLEDLHAALGPVIDRAATPDLVPKGAMVLQPNEERRRSGSHYTPRSLTKPIVQTTLEPILARLRGANGRPPTPVQILDLKVCDPAMGSGAFLVEACRQLGDALVEAWRAHDEAPVIPPDEDEFVYAYRLVAQRCLYGVDRNPVAVDLSKVSLWLVTLAKDHPLTFVDHALRHGDSLVGLKRRQIQALHWEGEAPMFQEGLETMRVREHLEKIGKLRHQIRDAGEGVTDEQLHVLWDQAERELDQVRLLGDLVVAAFFDGERPKEREAKRQEFARQIANGEAERHRSWIEGRRHSDLPLAPFHWEIEFPEVFDRENGGFDAIVGNPPFVGGRKVGGSLGYQYVDWLADVHRDSSGNADLVAHFFRRTFDHLRTGGTFGLIATNTIGQGDTRSTGLRWICSHGGDIFAVTKRVKWPGLAAVVVSVIHVMKGVYPGSKWLDGREVKKVTAFLFHRGGHENPSRLAANTGKSFQGSIVLGMGFTFDDTDNKGVATPLAEMDRLVAANPRNQEVIFPYIGGDEVNTSPAHAPHRYVIDFRDRDEGECRTRWEEAFSIVEEKVRPERTRRNPEGAYALREPLPTRWWQHADKRPALYAAIAGLECVLSCTLHTKDLSFSRLPSRAVFSHALAVFPLTTYAAFCALQARPHEVWARFFGSSLGETLRYTPSDCFETFPFPEGWETHPDLEAAGQTYYEFRAALMVRNNEGLTKTYNRFHDPDERDPEIVRLRELHAAMDRAVLDAYGWSDLPTECEFLLDYEIDEEEWGTKKRPYRYRWPDDVQAELLARLLELNAERAREESRSGKAAGTGGKPPAKPRRRSGIPQADELF